MTTFMVDPSLSDTKTHGNQVLLCDPMLATGGSALMAIRCLMEAGVKESAVVFVTVVVCPEVRQTPEKRRLLWLGR